MEDPVDAALSTCSTLLSVVNVEGSPIIQFSHFSVKEFLTSARLSKAKDRISRRYYVSMTPAHTLAAQACLGILLHLKTNITSDSLQDYPLAEYAAKHWVDHVHFDNVWQSAEDGLKQLFNSSQQHFAIWIWIYDPRLTWTPSKRPEKPLQPRATTLHYAAACGLHSIVEFLVIEHPQDVDCQAFDDNLTPLHVAPYWGCVQVARTLIKHGADMVAQNMNGKTPLHRASANGHVEVTRLLLEDGVDATAQDRNGRTPLHQASEYGHAEVARILFEHGADATAKDSDRWTPFHLASAFGHAEDARVLVGHGADVTAQDGDGWAPLHLASAGDKWN